MKKRGILLLVLLSMLLPAEDNVKLPPKDKFYLVLLIGQSNMAGRGIVTKEDKVPFPRVLMLNRDGKWVSAVDPVHYDKKSAGVGPGRTFGRLLAEQNPDCTVGLIPAACGGSSLLKWQPGIYFKATDSHPYDDAVKRAKKAMEHGTLKVILFHQGESDCRAKNAPKYEALLSELIARLRKDLNAEQVPLLVGELSSWSPWNAERKQVDAAQRAVVGKMPPAAFVSARGLTSNKDKVHFDRKSQLIFGERYFQAYQELLKNSK